jgi:5-methylcytosine-specific restriction endonuclease McrA
MSDSGSWITALRRLAVYLRDGFCCVYCERDLHNVRPSEITLDHVRATGAGHRGADHSNHNIVTACSQCNSSKKDRTLATFANDAAKRRVRNALRRKVNVALARSIIASR